MAFNEHAARAAAPDPQTAPRVDAAIDQHDAQRRHRAPATRSRRPRTSLRNTPGVGGKRPPAAIVLLSDGAPTGQRPGRGRAGRAQAAHPDLHRRARHAPGHDHRPAGSDGGAETRARPARPAVARRRSRRASGGRPSPPPTPTASATSTSASARSSATKNEKHQITAGLRGRRPRAAARRRRHVPALVRPPDLNEEPKEPMTESDRRPTDPAPRGAARRPRGGAVRDQARDRRPGRDARAPARRLLAGGHVLLEGVPGLAKTLTVQDARAGARRHASRRIQFTPDLVPADLVGTRVYRPDTGRFDTELGPVFGNFLLADEINRAPAKVQSALLEVMQEQPGDDRRRRPTRCRMPFLVHGDAEPDRVRGHLPAARGAGRPLPDEDPRRLPDRSARRRRSSGRSLGAAAQSRECLTLERPRALHAGRSRRCSSTAR